MMGGIVKRHKAFGIMVIIQLTSTGMTLLSKAAMSRGMKPSVFAQFSSSVVQIAMQDLHPLLVWAPIMKQYPAKLRLVTLQCSICCVVSTIWGAIMERDLSSWKLGWDINLLSVVYCGIVVTGIAYWLQAWVVEKKGPVYASIFNPLALMLTAFFSVLFLNETLHWGSVLGAALLVLGLYGFLWGKQKEQKNMEVVVNQSKEGVELDTISRTSTDIQVIVVNQSIEVVELDTISRTSADAQVVGGGCSQNMMMLHFSVQDFDPPYRTF
nr:WAT1-related protein At1g43650-like [Ipomoea batatas]